MEIKNNLLTFASASDIAKRKTKHNTMSKVKLTDVQKQKVSLFLSEQLTSLREEKRIGRMHYHNAPDNFLKSLEQAIRVGIAEEIWNR